MPFVQRIVQPVNVAQATAASIGHASNRFHCVPGKCKNNNCINKQQLPEEENVGDALPSTSSPTHLARALVHHVCENGDDEPRPPAALPMKKLKQHVEFLSTSPTPNHGPSRHVSQSLPNSRHPSQQRSQMGKNASLSAPQSPTAGGHYNNSVSKVISGHEFDSISNITLSNALRQLASLVLIASDIFDELQRDLQSVGERATRVQRKIAAVEKRVCAYDPKTVTVPESDLLTFAQRKQHYETDKSFQKELFTSDTRPHSVKQLYTEAGKELLPITVSGSSAAHSTAITPPRSISLNGDLLLNDHDVLLNGSAANGAADEEHLLCISDFGNANRRLRTRIDAEIEIRLPAAIEDLRKWTSSEALGDVTVTPDCMHHVDTSISTSMVIGDNGVLTPALSPSVLSADAVDALYGQNLSQPVDSGHHQPNHQPLLPNDINKDVPLNHRLPSPEEQTKLIALKYPAEVISVNTSGKHFQRMCAARKSTTGCYAGGQNGTNAPSSSSSASPENNQTDANNLDDNLQTVSRRSRSRKVRGKRRNTIAGIDQKEIQDAANGHRESKNASSSATSPAPATSASVSATDGSKKSKKFGRSKSSDILKKESVALPYDKGKSTLTRLNSLKQWGRNRFKFMQRNGEMNGFGESSQLDTSGCSSQNSSAEKPESSINTGGGSGMIAPLQPGSKQSRNIDDECVVHDLITQKSESRFSHERKPSYSSSEKSMTVSSSGQLRGKLQLAAAHVKMRETATLNRQRRNGLHGLAGKDEQPHSSSGNWSASSESGRASIGSEITMTHPKSSASNTSLNVSSFQPCGSSGPPSSMLSRRRFLNTSASSSVTSEGTATPELQSDGCAGTYPNHLDDETSSAYSCDTEGYYTSFHMDSGLRTLKEEEPPMTPLQQSLHTSSYSFGSQSNQTVLNAENEYELYGRGSTSTTTSSAGTVCTTLLNAAAITGPDVPERTSSLGKHSSSRSQSNSASNSTLERSYSSSTIGSTLERTGTIKRNVKLTAQSEDSSSQLDHQQQHGERSAMPLPSVCAGELEYSESSDLEGVERIERIKQKTAITSKRIPSMCIITPTTSDDDEHHDRTLTNLSVEVEHDEQEVEEAEQLTPTNASSKDYNLNELKQTPTKALSGMFEKLKVKLVSGNKISPPKPASSSAVNDDELYDMAGEYVTIADISNNNNKNHPLHNRGKMHASSAASSSLGIYYSNDIVRQVKAEQSSGSGSASATANSTSIAEYVSLNELPQHLRRHAVVSNPNHPPKESGDCAQLPSGLGEKAAVATSPPSAHRSGSESCGVPMYAEISELREEKSLISSATSGGNGGTQQRRVRTNAEGKIIYDSDSLKRRKGAHTTFAPGPYVKETESALLSATREVTGESASSSPPSTGLSSTTASATKSAKLLLLNGGGAVPGTRKVANVRPIVSKSPLSKSPNTSGMSVYSGNYQEQKQMLANHTNPFYETIATPSNMMPSPSGKSNSSTGSTATNSSSSGNSGEEGKQQQQDENEEEEEEEKEKMQKDNFNANCNFACSLPKSSKSPNCPPCIPANVNNTLLCNTATTHNTTTKTTTEATTSSTMCTINNNNNKNSNTKFASMSSISSVEKEPKPKNNESKVRVVEMETYPPELELGEGVGGELGPPTQPPPLPPRGKVVNGHAMAISSPIPTFPIPTPTPPPAAAAAPSLPVVSLSIDPIALQFPSKSRSALKRNNSYRLANDDLKLEMNKENNNNNNNTSYTLDPNQSALPPIMQYATGSLKLSHRHNVATPNGSGNGNASVCGSGSGGERRIAKSFERLVDEFSLSLTTGNDSSYLKNKSLENFDDSPALATVADEQETKSGSDTDSDSDDDSEMTTRKPPMAIKYQKSFVENILLRPFKIILPNEDNGGRRQRILQKFEVTEIW